ncbi:hypothetical protein [Microbacterium sp. CFBP9034]|uniref:hypothetical protein n=1 Tax=Microbacterium sp. CFBP9034 TaxID=3096540 RepID=UPI002A69A217|nr:hypothetical protein [Microbacterium sp. CFBP9034]MDY0908398.1 hypothetical protein [Microbacterium sp. CFBP9034]
MPRRFRSTVALAVVAVLASASTVAIMTHSGDAEPASFARTAPDGLPGPDREPQSSPMNVSPLGSGSERGVADGLASLAAISEFERELLYVPIVPCRAVDTRKAGGKLAAGVSRSFLVTGADGFIAQGGKSGGCGIPEWASSATFSFTTVESSGKGRLNAWPVGLSEPTSTVLSYTSANKVTSNPTVALPGQGTPHLRVRNYDYSTHLVIDVTGYYIGQMYSIGDPTGAPESWSRQTGYSHDAIGAYTVWFDVDLTACVAVASSPYAANIVTAYAWPDWDAVSVDVWDSAGNPVDGWFNVVVHC